jgi:hypothetical protein
VSSKKQEIDVRIVVIDNRFVAVGVYEPGSAESTLSNAAIVRRWGTTKGLGQIAEGGPTENTVLDPAPTMHVNNSRVLYTVKCDAAKWKKALKL